MRVRDQNCMHISEARIRSAGDGIARVVQDAHASRIFKQQRAIHDAEFTCFLSQRRDLHRLGFCCETNEGHREDCRKFRHIFSLFYVGEDALPGSITFPKLFSNSSLLHHWTVSVLRAAGSSRNVAMTVPNRMMSPRLSGTR